MGDAGGSRPGAGPGGGEAPLGLAVLGGLAIAQIVLLATLLAEPAAAVPPDFVLVWIAGVAARAGEAARLYDPAFAKAAEVAAFGRDFVGVYRWVYPPPLLLFAAPLSLLPFGAAQAAFTAATFLGFALVLRRVAGRAGLLIAFAWPASLACAAVGQNGFLTAALLGAGVLLLDRRPLVAGALFGLLAVKPHVGLMIPIALVAAGQWRGVGAAAAAGLGLAALALAAFGLAPWSAFLSAAGQNADGLLGTGIMGFGKLQSVYGLARVLGLPSGAAGLLQGAAALVGAALVWRVWRDAEAPASLRLASLAAATALATPYLYLYDMPILALAAAGLLAFRPGRVELALLGLAVASLLLHPFTGAPTGLGATLILAGMVAARACVPTASALTLPAGR